MTTFKIGDLVVPKNEDQKKAILSQASYNISFPCRIVSMHGSGSGCLLYVKKKNGNTRGLYAYRFSKVTPLDKPLEHYM